MRQAKLWTKNLILATVTSLLLYFVYQMLLPTIPLYIKDWLGSDSLVGIITGVGTLPALLIRPVTGGIIDRFGRRGFLLGSIVLSLFTVITLTWIPFAGIVIVIRLLNGVGWGVSTTITSTIATDSIPKKRFSEGLGYFSLAGSIAMALAPTLGLWVMSVASFGMLTYIASLLIAVSAVTALMINYKKADQAENIAEKGKSSQGALTWSSLIERAALFPSFLTLLLSITFGAVLTFVSLFAQERSINDIGFYFTVCAVTQILTRPYLGKFVDRYGFRFMTIAGFVSMIIATVLLSIATDILLCLVSAFIFGLGFAATQATLQTMSIIHTPKERYGAANATYFAGVDSGVCIGTFGAGFIASAIGYANMFLVSTIPLLLGLCLYCFSIIKKNIAHNSFRIPE